MRAAHHEDTSQSRDPRHGGFDAGGSFGTIGRIYSSARPVAKRPHTSFMMPSASPERAASAALEGLPMEDAECWLRAFEGPPTSMPTYSPTTRPTKRQEATAPSPARRHRVPATGCFPEAAKSSVASHQQEESPIGCCPLLAPPIGSTATDSLFPVLPSVEDPERAGEREAPDEANALPHELTLVPTLESPSGSWTQFLDLQEHPGASQVGSGGRQRRPPSVSVGEQAGVKQKNNNKKNNKNNNNKKTKAEEKERKSRRSTSPGSAVPSSSSSPAEVKQLQQQQSNQPVRQYVPVPKIQLHFDAKRKEAMSKEIDDAIYGSRREPPFERPVAVGAKKEDGAEPEERAITKERSFPSPSDVASNDAAHHNNHLGTPVPRALVWGVIKATEDRVVLTKSRKRKWQKHTTKSAKSAKTAKTAKTAKQTEAVLPSVLPLKPVSGTLGGRSSSSFPGTTTTRRCYRDARCSKHFRHSGRCKIMR